MHAVPGFPSIDREALLHAVVSGGGAMLLAYAMWAHATDRARAAQVRGLVTVGIGFLLTAGASMYLRDRGAAGVAVSLVGTALALRGTRALLRDRVAHQPPERPTLHTPPRDP